MFQHQDRITHEHDHQRFGAVRRAGRRADVRRLWAAHHRAGAADGAGIARIHAGGRQAADRHPDDGGRRSLPRCDGSRREQHFLARPIHRAEPFGARAPAR